MLLHLNILVLLVLQSTLSAASPQTTPSRGCPTCESKTTQGHLPLDSNTTSLAVGEPCGVYTRSCANGLRCAPPEDEPRPLRALLEGRGVCNNASSINTTDMFPTAVKSPHHGSGSHAEDPNEVPCRKLLISLIKGLYAHVIDPQQDIYMPNCDKRGFFRRKQCWSSRGKQRGKCWCVNQNGVRLSSGTSQKGHLTC